MLRKFGADVPQAVDGAEPVDARSTALALMSKALGHLDSDSSIPPVIGAQLQMAIDTLSASVSPKESPEHFH